jgi:hypothetical protein
MLALASSPAAGLPVKLVGSRSQMPKCRRTRALMTEATATTITAFAGDQKQAAEEAIRLMMGDRWVEGNMLPLLTPWRTHGSPRTCSVLPSSADEQRTEVAEL